MVFGDIQTWIGNQLIMLFIVVGGAIFMAKRAADANPEIKNAAKNAAKSRMLGFLTRWGGKR